MVDHHEKGKGARGRNKDKKCVKREERIQIILKFKMERNYINRWTNN